MRTLLLALAICLAAAACGSAAPATPTPDPAGDCDPVELSAEELNGGFLAEPGAPADAAVRIEAVLAIGGNGPQLTGRDIAYAYVLRGSEAIVATELGLTAVRAAVADSATTATCQGSTQVVLTPGAKGGASVVAELGGMAVTESGSACTSIRGSSSVAVECPLVSVRRDDQATSGTLWLRIALAGAPEPMETLPGWALEVPGVLPTDPPVDAKQVASGTVSVDGGEPVVALEGASVALRTDLGRQGYYVTLPFDEQGSVLRVVVPGIDPDGEVAGHVSLDLAKQYPDAWHTTTYQAPCDVSLTAGGLTGTVSCVLSFDIYGDPAVEPVTVDATWQADRIIDLIGDGLRVTWRLEGGIVSEGSATVQRSLEPGPDPGLLILPEVPIDRGSSPAVLRLRVLGFSGDGDYSGSSVDPAIDILTDSQLLATPAVDPEPQPWTPIFGLCTATVREDGARGTMTCPGDPAFPTNDPTAGSVTMHAAWEPET